MDDLVIEFITETTESLAEIDLDLVKLEQDPNDKDLLSNIFRLMHTIKGTCGFLGLPRLEKVAHAAENVLGKFRDGELEVKPEYVTLIFESIDRVRYLLSEIEENDSEPEGEDSELIDKLDAVFEGRDSQSTESSPKQKPQEKATKVEGGLSQEELDALEAAFQAADGPDEVDVSAIEATDDKGDTPMPEVQDKDVKSEAVDESEKKAKTSSVASQSLRVNMDVLENLMTMVSELVLTRNQLLQLLREHTDSEFSGPLQRLNHVVSDLQEGVMQTRMQPIGNAWAKLPRIIRDLSIELNKKIDLQMNGQDTELDRQVLDLIKDPLTHMVRNSGDHGIESPEDRLAAGKPETGKIKLNAFHEGGHIIIEIEDDGKGLNTDKIKAKALSNNVISEEEAETLSDKQIHQFIFAAGFSTADKVTAVSGRGVGMDVVRTNIEKIGGTIDLDSKEGKGSKFTIKIPLTLAIVSSMIVQAAGERFAIPQLSVKELVMVGSNEESKIEMIKGTPVYRLRERLLPLIYLKDLLKLHTDVDTEDQSQAQASEGRYIVVTQVGAISLGIIVDQVFDTEEIVVKPVAPILKDIEIFSGNTILGDGSVIMILDPAGIAKTTGDMNVSNEADELRAQEEEARRRRDMEKTSLILFKAGNNTPKAVPLSLIARLEEIPTSSIEFSGNQMLIQYRGDLMPLMKFDESKDISTEDSVPCLVFSSQGNAVGLIIDEIIDIMEDHLNVKMNDTIPGVMGSSVIAGKATDVIDVPHYIEKAFGTEWYGDTQTFNKSDKENNKKRILLVDDSPFFRNMLTPLLSMAGYDVTAAESPFEALELADQGAAFDLIVSDIEMPDMNGFEFAEKIKSGSNWQDTPLVALSSHATDEDRSMGIEKGFSSYVAKFDRDTLLSTLSETLSEETHLAKGQKG